MKVLFFLSQMSVTNGETSLELLLPPQRGQSPAKGASEIKKKKKTEWFWNCICGMTSYNRFPLLRWEYRRGSNVHTTAYRRCWFSWKLWRISGRAMVRASGTTTSAAHLGRTFRRGRGTCDEGFARENKKNRECRRRLRECFVCNWSVTLLGIINNCVEKKKKKNLECSWSHYGIKAILLSPRLASG